MTKPAGELRSYHAPAWDEPLVMQLGHPGRRGQVFATPDSKPDNLVPPNMRRAKPPYLPRNE